jgi:ADP-glucose pyrophosphorylase
VGERSVIKNCQIIKDVKIGPSCYIKGANKLKNLTINSSFDEPSQIGEGVELVNGFIARGCRIFYGCKAVRFIMGHNSSLKYGARLIHSYLGDNSTVSCCEILNNLIFPAHEQHHNNSFLTASLMLGQSNIAAGATIGSNHNGRAPDGEIVAGRGFWPGLCVSLNTIAVSPHMSCWPRGIPLRDGHPPALQPGQQRRKRRPAAGNPAFWWLYNM